MAKTEQEEKRNSRLVGAARTSGELVPEWRRLQRKNLNILRLPRRKEWPRCHKVSSWQVRQSRLCQKEKSHVSRSPIREVGVKMSENRTLARERGASEREHGEERVGSTVKEGRFHGGEGGQAKKTSLREVGESMRE